MRSCRSYGRAEGPGTSAGVRFLRHAPYLERIQGVLDGVPRGPVGPPGPLEFAALLGTCEMRLLIVARMNDVTALVTSGAVSRRRSYPTLAAAMRRTSVAPEAISEQPWIGWGVWGV